MLKRVSNGSADLAGVSRPKRPRTSRDALQAGDASSDVDAVMSDHGASDVEDGEDNAMGTAMAAEEVKTLGSTLFQTIRDAVSKDGRLLSPVFLKKPPKRQYPDYYVVIQQPIAFEDIKSKLDKGGYPTLEAVRQDFELCFNNAKHYNLEGSQIWNDARDLLKLTNKTYGKLVPKDGDEKKSKPPSLNRLLKTRLQRLVEKKDPMGRALSTEFMELPSRKIWPEYYKQIKKPQCFGNIFKRLKRKEYSGSEDFAADVELVFSNAMAFNQDHTPIWEDAVSLRTHFRQLMSDLPPQYAVPQYTQPSAKIKIKPSVAHSSSSVNKNETLPSLKLRVPAAAPAAKKPPAPLPEPTLPVARNIAKPLPAQPATPAAPTLSKAFSSPGLPVMKASATPRPVATPVQQQRTASAATHYPSTSFAQTHAPPPAPPPIAAPVATPVVREQVQVPAATPVRNVTPAVLPAPAPVSAPTPVPPPVFQHQLKCARIEIQPRGRIVHLDHRDGVKSWAIRLAPGESRIIVSGAVFLDQHDDDDDESSSEEEEEEDGDDDMDVDSSPTKNGRVKKAKGKRRGRPPTRASARQATLKTAKKASSKPGDIQLKVNKLVIKEQPEKEGEWDIHLPVGPSILEVGEIGGLVWKLYVDRMGNV